MSKFTDYKVADINLLIGAAKKWPLPKPKCQASWPSGKNMARKNLFRERELQDVFI